MKGDTIYIVYADGTSLAGPNLDNINKEITWLGVSTKDQTPSSNLEMKGKSETS